MKKIYLILAVLALLGAFIPEAPAFSIDQSANLNSDGSQKFADPDEQAPAFMVGPSGQAPYTRSFSSSDTVTMPTIGNNDKGAQAFDQAYAHQQNKN